VPASCQLRSGTFWIGTALMSCVPFISQTWFSPVLVFRQTMSGRPSRLKSAAAPICHGGARKAV
jgi:hypothetical protein